MLMLFNRIKQAFKTNKWKQAANIIIIFIEIFIYEVGDRVRNII